MTDSLFTNTSEDQLEDKNYLEEYVGDGKKFASVEDLAKGKAHSDRHIHKLETELQELRNELRNRETVEKLMEKFNKQPDVLSNQNTNTGENDVDKNQPDIEQIIEQRLTQREQKLRQEANFEMVRNTLAQKYGESVNVILSTKAKELDMTPDQIDAMARTQPKVLLALLGDAKSDLSGGKNDKQPEPAASLFNPPNSRVNTTGMPKGTSNVRNFKYYEDLRRNKPREFMKPEVHLQMMKDIKELGEENFYR